ncbi:MAG: ABC transporter ATP-binding protein [Pseudomonadota bacterium]|nr:ABC transporter ATP-binding protein [Pseudomonadota bacterium]
MNGIEPIHKDAAFPSRPSAFLLHYLRRHLLHHGSVLLLVVGAVSASIGAQYGMKLLVDAMADAGRAPAPAWHALTAFLAFIATENLLWRCAGFLGSRAILRVKADVRIDLFTHLTGHAPRYFAEHLAGALANRITATADAAHGILGTLLWNIIPPLADFCGAVIVLTLIDARLAVALGLFVLVVAGTLALVGLRGTPRHLLYADRAAVANGELVDVVGNMWAVKAFSARLRERTRLAGHLERERTAQLHAWSYLEWMRVFHDACLCLMAGGILVWAVRAWSLGAATPGDVVVVSALTFRILHGSKDLALACIGLLQQEAQLRETLKVVAAPHDLPDRADARPLVATAGEIEVHDVTFAHPRRGRVFEHFSLLIPGGQSVGLVGPSGAGKTTLTSLLQRLDDVQEGRILVDGQDIRDVAQDSLRAAFAVVPQDIALFHRSVVENIRYGRPDATDAEVHAAARAARCEEFITGLPEGWDTVVGERGIKLSGGQRQRLGIARAILKDAPILIFDEATSALDTESEQAIQAALVGLTRGRTVIAVAHRLSTIAHFDRVVVLSGGRIVEDGAPDELRLRRGAFAAMWRLQAEGFLKQRAGRG